MPAIDYVSIVKSVYGDRRAMVLGALCCVVGVSTGAIKTGSPILWAIAVAFVLVAIYRYVDMARFAREQIQPEDAATAAKWEVRATYGATMFAFLCGAWCFSSFVFVQDPTAEILSMVTTVGCMVGVVTRNFGLDRLLTIQLAIAVTLIGLGVLLKNDVYHWVLGGLMLPMLVSFRYLAADVRQVLLNAVHSRVEAKRLASQLDAALETMQHGLCMLDEAGLIAVSNERAEAMFSELVGQQWKGRPLAAIISSAAASGLVPQRAAEQLIRMINNQRCGKVVLNIADRQHVEVTVSSAQERTVLLFEDITERVLTEERINFMAHYDSLTGLPNRAFFSEQVKDSLEQVAEGEPGHMASLMIIDIDDFKHVNDTMGHLIGDRVLVETAERVGKALGSDHVIARLGGDEFIAYRIGKFDLDDVDADAQALLHAFATPFHVMGEVFPAAVSIGVVTSRDRADDLDVLMTRADLALYKAKANGKSQSQVFREEMDTDYRRRQRLKSELKLALVSNGLNLAYQPIVDLKTRRVTSCEALARWTHPELGVIPPSVFIPIAEETGLISDITDWVLRSAARECQQWPENVSVSVNVSARDFRSADVRGMVEGALAETGLAPQRLEIEVTETALIENKDVASSILSQLAARGVGIALDDFGTGYSSLSYLHAMPFTKLKIDRIFVMDILESPRALKLLSNVARMGKDINLTVTAEGVETEEQLNAIIESTAVDQIQGFLFGVPLPSHRVAELISRMAGESRHPVQASKMVNSR
jgi:diguanylate cyclase (GGDEF)-like protein